MEIADGTLIDIINRINTLERLYEQLDAFFKHEITLSWAIIAGVLVGIGFALYFIAKGAVDSGIKNGIKATQDELINHKKMILDLSRNIESQLESIRNYEYEKGAWTPRLQNQEGEQIRNAGKGIYTKIKDKVILECWIDVKGKDDLQCSNDRPIYIAGLPFPIKSEFKSIYAGNSVVTNGLHRGNMLHLFLKTNITIAVYSDKLESLTAGDIDEGFSMSFTVVHNI